jgi:hypothetical protein
MERLSFEMEGVGFSTAAQSILNAKGRRTLLGRAEIGGRAAATLTAVGERSGPKCFMPSHVSAWANQSRYRGAEGRQWVYVDGQHCNGLPARFYGSVEIDMVRPIKSFDAILNAVVMELQRTQGAKVKLTLEVEAKAASGFSEADVGLVRDNARQLKFKAESTGFEE